MMVVGTKLDLETMREVKKEEGAELARKFNCRFLEVSAKTRENVELSFIELVREIRRYINRENEDKAAKENKKKNKKKKRCNIM